MEPGTQPLLQGGLSPKTSVSFTLNGEPVVVTDAAPCLSLNEWIRAQPGLTGTKKMCGEGGCGCCIVAVTRMDAVARKETTVAINSCLCSLYSVEGWHITTVEGIGSSTMGFHPIQQQLAQHNGSQCGYCTPGFVMNMYSLLQQNPQPTQQAIEDAFDGNICRCTGYRSILDAMKSFAVDADPGSKACVDIEDLGSRVCPHSGGACQGRDLCKAYKARETDAKWYQPSSLDELFGVIGSNPGCRVKLFAGDTGKGIFKKPKEVDIVINLNGIPSLSETMVTESSLVVGGAVSLSNLIGLLQTNQGKSVTFEHLASHLLKVANVPVRNVGTWAGNLMLTHDNDNFPSDVFTMMAAAGATLTIAFQSGSVRRSMSLWDFLKQDMTNSVIVSMVIPFASNSVTFKSFKIMPRAQNSHAYVNAAFSMEMEPDGSTVKGKPLFVYGGIEAHSISASATEAYMEGKNLQDPNTLKGALECLEKELAPNSFPAAASPQYRKSLAIGLFYKFYLAAISSHSRVYGSTTAYQRPISQGCQSFSSKEEQYPITEPMTKLTAMLQTSGEAQYTTDIPTQLAELSAAFVLTSQANAKITKIDSSKAEQMPGCFRVLTAADIPKGGENNFLPKPEYRNPEKVFAEDFSEYAGQAVALVLADTQENAVKIAQKVEVCYERVGKPVLTIQEAIQAGSFYGKEPRVRRIGDAKAAIASSAHVIHGEISCGSQFHFSMETQTTLCIPEDDGYTLYSSSQWASLTQAAVGTILGVPANSVNVSVKRVGGAYGSKISRCHQIAAACALGAHLTRRPVRMHMDIDTNMKMVGKRFPYYASYTIGSTEEGVVNGIEVSVYDDCGISRNDSSLSVAVNHLDNAYHVPNWLVTSRQCKTNTASNTYCRSPGTVPGIFISESMMDHLARSLSKDVEEVKKANLYKQGQVLPCGMPLQYCQISSLWEQLYQSADVAARKEKVAVFNQASRWRKRGFNMMPIRYGLDWLGFPYSVHLSVYQFDGTVAIAHGGVEVGQGINTKVVQVAAKTLGIPMELIKIKPTNTLVNANDAVTGGSLTSEVVCQGTLNTCKELNNRIQPMREKHPGASWKKIIQLCYDEGIDLVARDYVHKTSEYKFAYNCYGTACTEVEVDVLTGQTEVLRVDILYDCGDSINPVIDVGQVQGAYMMGLGYWLTEKIVYDGDSGKLLTHNTWEYKPPCSKDIPVDFRVELLKNAPNPVGILGSKCVGEPPQCLSCSALFAVKRAIESARAEIGKDAVFTLSGPATVEDIQQACLVEPSQFTF